MAAKGTASLDLTGEIGREVSGSLGEKLASIALKLAFKNAVKLTGTADAEAEVTIDVTHIDAPAITLKQVNRRG